MADQKTPVSAGDPDVVAALAKREVEREARLKVSFEAAAKAKQDFLQRHTLGTPPPAETKPARRR